MPEQKRIKSYLYPMDGRGPYHYRPGEKRPDVIFISVDMVPPEFYLKDRLGMETNTPYIDTLKSEGLFFANGFATSPLCSPSRASYLTGRYSDINSNEERGHRGSTFRIRPDDNIFPQYLKSIGYHLRHVGKCHVGTEKFLEVFGENDTPWDRWSPPWYDDDAYLDFLRRQGFDRLSFDRTIYGSDPAGTKRGNFYGGWIADQERGPFPKDATYSAFLVEKAMASLAARPKDRPLYLQLDFFGPHQPFAVPGGMEDREREIRKQMGLPASFLTLLKNEFRAAWPEPRVYRMYRKNWGMTDKSSALDYRIANLLQFEMLDELLGRFLSHLKDEGLYDESWIVFIADHGEMNLEGALVDKGAFLHPKALRAPIIVKPPSSYGEKHRGTDRAIPRGLEVDCPTSLLDLAPTILSSCGVDVEERLDGEDLLHLLKNGQRSEGRELVFEIGSHVMPNPCVATIFKASDGSHYLYSYNATDDMDELYELNTEDEYRNIIESEEKAGIVDEAVQHMDSVLSNDRRWFSYSQFFRLENAERLEIRGDRQLFKGS